MKDVISWYLREVLPWALKAEPQGDGFDCNTAAKPGPGRAMQPAQAILQAGLPFWLVTPRQAPDRGGTLPELDGYSSERFLPPAQPPDRLRPPTVVRRNTLCWLTELAGGWR
jgi:hypothetical protein